MTNSENLVAKIRTQLGGTDIRLISDSLSEIFINHLHETRDHNLDDEILDDQRNTYECLKRVLSLLENEMDKTKVVYQKGGEILQAVEIGPEYVIEKEE